MKNPILLAALVMGGALVGCNSEEAPVPVSAQDKAAFDAGQSGPPPEAKGTDPMARSQGAQAPPTKP